MPPFLVLLLTQGTGNEFSPWLMGVATLLGLAVLAHLGLAFAHRCPACTKHPTIQGFKPTHPAALSQSSLSGWGGAVMNIIKRRRLVCVHCGSAYAITDNSQGESQRD